MKEFDEINRRKIVAEFDTGLALSIFPPVSLESETLSNSAQQVMQVLLRGRFTDHREDQGSH